MPSGDASYRLKRFERGDDPAFAAALLLYIRNTPAATRTDANEITYWLDRFSTTFGDAFYAFGFYRNHELVGFAEAAYFVAERLFVIDYLVIDAAMRQNNVFFEFVDQLQHFLETKHPDYRYGVAEVCYGSGQARPTQESALIVRLLKMQGFKVIRAPYYQPRLAVSDPESEVAGDLLLYSTAAVDRIHAETYIEIVRVIYYKYYLPWQTVTPKDVPQYKAHVDALFDRVRNELSGSAYVMVNGHKAILNPNQGTATMKVHRLVAFAFQALAVVVLLTGVMLGLQAAFHLSGAAFATIYGLAIISFVAVVGILSENARNIFGQIVSLLKFAIRSERTTALPSDDVTNTQPNSPPTGVSQTSTRDDTGPRR